MIRFKHTCTISTLRSWTSSVCGDSPVVVNSDVTIASSDDVINAWPWLIAISSLVLNILLWLEATRRWLPSISVLINSRDNWSAALGLFLGHSVSCFIWADTVVISGLICDDVITCCVDCDDVDDDVCCVWKCWMSCVTSSKCRLHASQSMSLLATGYWNKT